MIEVLNIRELGLAALLPPDVQRIDRPSPWGNPYRIGDEGYFTQAAAARFRVDRELAIVLFRMYAQQRLAAEPDWLEPLRGKRLACWCAPLACHGDVIAELLEAPSAEA